ncbi:MAG: replicative DNA helicase [Leptospiraceae bacterium]|nr:replicative DNA helicase [Leptospiraceae bacterium]MCK6380877.1 replicative DNA helicase [Leptospiraceae bacterium]NUM41281.1 replicative DNA helicase [Leptospiraceae bacterium]
MNPEPLYELETEKSFLGTILIKGSIIDPNIGLSPDDFYQEFHKKIFSTIIGLTDKNVTIDPISVINDLREKAGFRDEPKELEYIYSLYRDTVISQPLSYFIKRIKNLSDRRKYLSVLRESIQLINSDPTENESLFSKIEKDLAVVSKAVQSRGLRNMATDQNELLQYIKTLFENKGELSGLKTHYPELDELTTGLKSHELMILAARPGRGKTSLALNIAANVSLKDGKAVAMFSMEMSRLELQIKLICADARINSTHLRNGELHKSDQQKLKDSIVRICNAPIWIDDSGSLNLWEFRGRIRQLLTTQPLSLIIVDYLQLMNDPESKEGGRQQEVASISRNLKQMAKEANCPIIALSQMSRAIEQRSKDQRPQLSDLRESGAIEQDADIVAFIHREDMVRPPEEVKPEMVNKAEIIIAKNRSGRMKSFFLTFTPEYGKFDTFMA